MNNNKKINRQAVVSGLADLLMNTAMPDEAKTLLSLAGIILQQDEIVYNAPEVVELLSPEEFTMILIKKAIGGEHV